MEAFGKVPLLHECNKEEGAQVRHFEDWLFGGTTPKTSLVNLHRVGHGNAPKADAQAPKAKAQATQHDRAVERANAEWLERLGRTELFVYDRV